MQRYRKFEENVDEDIKVNLVKRKSSEPKQGWKMLKYLNWSTAGRRWNANDHAHFQLPCFFSQAQVIQKTRFSFSPGRPLCISRKENMLIVSNRMHTSCIWPRNLPILEICEILPDVQMHGRLVSSDCNLFNKKKHYHVLRTSKSQNLRERVSKKIG